jgi:hypothetical protein
MKQLLIAATLAVTMSGTAGAATLYSNDFDGNITIGDGVGVTALDNGGLETAVTFGNWTGNYFANRSTGNPAAMSSLTLTNLLPHTQVSVSFVLGFLESWDGFDGACCSPDNLDIFIDGSKVATLTARNALGSASAYGGGTVIGEFVQANGNTFWSDTIVDMSTAGFLNFAHSASTLTLAIQAGGAGWQGSSDEAWGVDAIHITYDGVPAIPEPSTWALMLAGAGLVGAGVRSKRRRSA